ncbi:MAG: protein kinase [Clostridia bacterium]|nr:protein kinase [Clostridia bacterium]
MNRCMYCMREFDKELKSCPYCGTEHVTEPGSSKHLYPETVLNGRYIVGYSIDVNSIFVTYAAWDNEEGKKVLINEFLPNNFVGRNEGDPQIFTKSGDAEDKYYAGMKAFADECRDLIDIEQTDVIAGFEENNTYYAVRKIVKGTSLAEIIDDDYEITNEYARRVVVAVLKALAPVHELGIIHGNITPDTVIIDENSSIVLTDFSFCGYMARIMPVYTNEGYSPAEQYRSGAKLTTAVDIYSIGAVFYELITGEIPVTATSRSKQDTLTPISEVKGVTLRPGVCNAIMNALNIRAENRTPDVEKFYEELKDKNTKRHWERFASLEKPKNDFYKKRGFWIKTIMYVMIAIMLICAAVIAFEILSIKRDVEKQKEYETEISTEGLPEEGKSIFDIFGSSEEESETTTETIESVPDDVESGSGILAVFSRGN